MITEITSSYSTTLAALPEAAMNQLAGEVRPTVEDLERGKTWVYQWPDLTARVSELTGPKLKKHLSHLEGYVKWLQKGEMSEQSLKVLEWLEKVTLGIGLEWEGEEAEMGRPETTEFHRRLVYLAQANMFNGTVFSDWKGGRALLGPGGEFDPTAEI
jgi:hypothetical protein